MYTSGYAHRSSSFSSAASKIARVSTENTTAGLISEVVYREDQPMMTQLLLFAIVTATRSAIALATLVNTATKTESGMGSGIWATLNESNAD
ncbi:SOS cell division inhibitor [Escherichia coli]|nr:SOS cell division inhibitor [Escherichia coli]